MKLLLAAFVAMGVLLAGCGTQLDQALGRKRDPRVSSIQRIQEASVFRIVGNRANGRINVFSAYRLTGNGDEKQYLRFAAPVVETYGNDDRMVATYTVTEWDGSALRSDATYYINLEFQADMWDYSSGAPEGATTIQTESSLWESLPGEDFAHRI